MCVGGVGGGANIRGSDTQSVRPDLFSLVNVNYFTTKYIAINKTIEGLKALVISLKIE